MWSICSGFPIIRVRRVMFPMPVMSLNCLTKAPSLNAYRVSNYIYIKTMAEIEIALYTSTTLRYKCTQYISKNTKLDELSIDGFSFGFRRTRRQSEWERCTGFTMTYFPSIPIWFRKIGSCACSVPCTVIYANATCQRDKWFRGNFLLHFYPVNDACVSTSMYSVI